jgi:hypothetical protein
MKTFVSGRKLSAIALQGAAVLAGASLVACEGIGNSTVNNYYGGAPPVTMAPVGGAGATPGAGGRGGTGAVDITVSTSPGEPRGGSSGITVTPGPGTTSGGGGTAGRGGAPGTGSPLVTDNSISNLPVTTTPPARDAGTPIAPDARPPAVKGECPDLDDNGVLDCRESLVKNGDFATGLAGWAAEPNATAAFDGTDDGDGVRTSGALAVTNTAMGESVNAFMVGARQCVNAGGGTYQLFGQVKLQEAGAATAGINVQFFNAADCGGAVSGVYSSSLYDSAPQWRTIAAQMPVPPSVRSMAVRLVVVKPYRQAPVKALFDNVLLRAR